jgi:hypothetical protein
MTTTALIKTSALSFSTDPTANTVNRTVGSRLILISRTVTDDLRCPGAASRPLNALYPSLFAPRISFARRTTARVHAFAAAVADRMSTRETAAT